MMSLESRPRLTRLSVCPVCGSNRLYYAFSVGTCRVTACNDCSLLWVNPQAGVDDPAIRDAPVIGGSLLAERVLKSLRSYHHGSLGHVALVGTDGAHLAEAASRADIATRHVDESALSSLAAQSFDVVVLDTSINRSPDPRRLLEEVRACLKPDGTLVATTPDIDSWAARQKGARSSDGSPAGRFYFNSTTLQSLLFQASFRKIIALPADGSDRLAPRDHESCVVFAQPVAPRARPLLSLIVPAFNEAATIGPALDRLLAKEIEGLDIEIVIVESNSTDGTRAIVERYGANERVQLVLEDRPRGKGHAVRAGLEKATGDFVLIQDADLEYDLEDYEVLLEPLVAGRHSFVLGARHGGQTWKIRQFNDQPLQALLLNLAHAWFTWTINVSLGLQLADPFTMYKVFRRDCLHGLTFECNRFDFDWELLIKLVRKGYRPVEIPVNYRSRSFKEGKKVSILRDPLTWMVALVRSRTAKIDLLGRDNPA